MPDEIIDIDIKDLDGTKSREERKANGRFAAVIVALVLFLVAIYHAWIRKTPVLAGILVPALIMIVYGGWVIFLTRRDKKRRLIMTRQMEEEARRELAALKLSKNNSPSNNFIESKNVYFDISTSSSSPMETPEKQNNRHRHHHHHHHHHHRQNQNNHSNSKVAVTDCTDLGESKHHKKQRHRRRKSTVSQNSCNSQQKFLPDKVIGGGVSKRPSFRQKIFRHNPYREALLVQSDLKYLELPPFLHRTNSAP